MTVVTDHALVRYLERCLDVDVEALRLEVLAICAEDLAAGASGVRKDGRAFVLQGGAVVTV